MKIVICGPPHSGNSCLREGLKKAILAIPDEKNKKICKYATHAIILFNDSKRVDEWRKFCHDLGINIIAEIYSDYHGEEGTEIKDGIFREQSTILKEARMYPFGTV